MITHGNNVNNLTTVSIKTIVYFIRDLIVSTVLRRRLFCSQPHFKLDLPPVDHYRQKVKRGRLQELLVHLSNLRSQKPFKTSHIIMRYSFLPHAPIFLLTPKKISHLFKSKDPPNLMTSQREMHDYCQWPIKSTYLQCSFFPVIHLCKHSDNPSWWSQFGIAFSMDKAY